MRFKSLTFLASILILSNSYANPKAIIECPQTVTCNFYEGKCDQPQGFDLFASGLFPFDGSLALKLSQISAQKIRPQFGQPKPAFDTYTMMCAYSADKQVNGVTLRKVVKKLIGASWEYDAGNGDRLASCVTFIPNAQCQVEI